MRYPLLIAFCLFFVLILSIVPASAAPSAQTNCDQGEYWLVQDNSWDTVWIRQGNSDTFDGFSALWMQPDVTATLTVSMDGDSVSVSRVDNPNPFGTLTGQYIGTLNPDGVTIVGSATGQLNTGTSLALSWSAVIHCDPTPVTWSDTAFWHRAAKNHQFSFDCPPNGTPQPIWGTDTYIEGSSICTAGVHAGAITLQDGGTVTIEILPGEPSYPGSTRNGVTSDTFPTAGQFNASFRVIGGQTQQPTATPVSGVTSAGSVLGVWNTDFGVITIAADGRGDYSDFGDPSHITFTHDDAHTVSGYWIEKSSARQCDTEMDGSRYWGRLHFTFDDTFTSFSGVWGYCNDDPTEGWGGARAS